MPLALLVVERDVAPIILNAETDADLLEALRASKDSPDHDSPEAAALWLWRQPFPSGWYRSPEEASARIQQDRVAPQMAAEQLKDIRRELGLSRASLADELGFSGTPNTRHKQIWEMEQARKPILPERARAAISLVALARLAELSGALPALSVSPPQSTGT